MTILSLPRRHPPVRRRRALSVALSLAAMTCLGPALGTFASQPQTPPPAEDATRPQPADIRTRIEALRAQIGADAPDIAPILEQAEAHLADAARAADTGAAFEEEAAAAPGRTQEITAFLETPIEQQVAPAPGPDVALTELRTELDAAEGRLRTERDLREKLQDVENTRALRRQEIPGEVVAATERLDAVRAALAAPAPPDEPAALTEAKRLRLLAELVKNERILAAREKELTNYEVRKALLPLRRQFRDRRIEIESRTIAQLQSAISRREISEAEAERAAAAAARRAAADAHPVVQTVLKANEEYATHLAEITRVRREDVTARQATEQDLIRWRGAFEQSQNRVRSVGLAEAVGLNLRRQKTKLPNVDGLENEIRRGIRDLAEGAGDRVRWDIRLEELEDLDAAVDQQLAAAETPLPDDLDARTALREAVRTGLVKQTELLNSMIEKSDAYVDEAALPLLETQRTFADLVREYRTYINERILWIRSYKPVGAGTIVNAGPALERLVDPDAWRAIGTDLAAEARRRPVQSALGVLAIALLIVLQRPLRRRLRQLGAAAREPGDQRLRDTVQAAVITVALAAEWPLLLVLVALPFEGAGMTNTFAGSIAAAVERVALLLFAAEVVRILCRPDGLADAHFHWRRPALDTVRRHLRWFIPVALPAAFLIMFTEADDTDHHSLGRLAFIAGMIASTIFLHRVTRPGAGVFDTLINQHRDGWVGRLRVLWLNGLILAPLALAALAASGYMFTAIELERKILVTTWLILGAMILRATLLRGLMIAQRRLAIEQARKKLAARRKAREVSGAAPGDVKSVEELEEIDLVVVSAQTRKLLNTGVILALVIGLVGVWADVLPAIQGLRQYQLWTVETNAPVVAESTPITGVDLGGDAAAAAPGVASITAADLLSALALLLITFFVSRDFPGLLEIGVLSKLPITPGARYAFVAVARYALAIIGVVLAFNTIGIGWSQVQFLAAAITVGLGFGLQEIFANFVSGLILLFERPIRVGDTVTVSNIHGRVTRIRMRATTIMDWDLKELIVPNREFVTGQIVNWTLSDAVLRVVVPVGVAYGSDIKKVERVLYDIARDDPDVLATPAPFVLFENFGDSTLNFSFRVFIPNIDVLLKVRHRLHQTIDDRFRKEDITIAFPQRDVHVHYVDPKSGATQPVPFTPEGRPPTPDA